MGEEEKKYKEYLLSIQKQGSKPYKISHCLGARDAWKWVRKNKWTALNGIRVSSSTYSEVIKAVNQELIKTLFESRGIEFPYQMGGLHITISPVRVKEKDGKIITNYRTDWPKTLRCWYDSTTKNRQQVIKRVQPSIYSIRYSKQKARFKYKHLYSFRPNRSLVRAFWRAVESGEIRGGATF